MRWIDLPTVLKGEKKKEWDDWIKRADKATADAIAAWEESDGKEKPKFKVAIWGELKLWLLENVFKNTCAFCEIPLDRTRAPSHAEHFRPKSGVKNKDKDENRYITGNTEDPDGKVIEHPGYFWLAYNWKNLLPSCSDCNTGPGKKNQFPIQHSYLLIKKLSAKEVEKLSAANRKPIASNKWKGLYYLDPEHLDELEGRLLLHPYFDKPRDYIEFGERGTVTAKEPNGADLNKGEHTIGVFALDAGGLDALRSDAQIKAYDDYMFVFRGRVKEQEKLKEAQDFARKSYKKNIEEFPAFSAAVDDYMSKILGVVGRGFSSPDN